MVKIHHSETINGFGNLEERKLNFFFISSDFTVIVQNNSLGR
jgi:hypothetical protein